MALLLLTAILATMFSSTSCVAYKSGGVYFGAVGTDADDLEVSAQTMRMKNMNNSPAFERAATMVEKMWNA